MKNKYNYDKLFKRRMKNDKIRIKNFVKEIQKFIKELDPNFEYIRIKEIQVIYRYIIIKFEFKDFHYIYGKILRGIIKIGKKHKIELDGIAFNSDTLYFYV